MGLYALTVWHPPLAMSTLPLLWRMAQMWPDDAQEVYILMILLLLLVATFLPPKDR